MTSKGKHWYQHGITPEQRFLRKIKVDPITGCWNWIAGLDKDGYGKFEADGKTQQAHIWSFKHLRVKEFKMYDPMTVAFEIKYPWKDAPSKFWPEGYRRTFITIWHVDPEKRGNDDSCDWFGRFMSDREKEWARKMIENENDNFRNLFSQWVKLPHGVGKCDDAEDCYCGEHVPIIKQEEMISRLLQIASCYKREFRKFRWHPRWHFWHWKFQCHPLQDFKRWAFSRCTDCGGHFKWGYSPWTNSWNGTGPLWFRSEKDVHHSDCRNPESENVAQAKVDA